MTDDLPPAEAPLSFPTDAELLAVVESFLERTGMTPTRFGNLVMSEGGLVKSLREGRTMTIRSANKLITFINEWRDDSGDAAAAATCNGGGVTDPASQAAA